MEVRLQKWGNYVGIRIPSSFLKALKLIKDYNGNNLLKDFRWDDARGKEIW